MLILPRRREPTDRAVNYGTGAVTVIAKSGAEILGGRYGIGAFAFDGGNVSIANYGYVTGTTAAIDVLSTPGGTIFIDNFGMITGDVINSGNATFHNEVQGAIWNLAGTDTFLPGGCGPQRRNNRYDRRIQHRHIRRLQHRQYRGHRVLSPEASTLRPPSVVSARLR